MITKIIRTSETRSEIQKATGIKRVVYAESYHDD